MAKPKQKPSNPEPRRLRLFVSSVVYSYEDLLESIYVILENFGYEVQMSYKGTVPIDPNLSAMSSCLAAVKDCDLFLGLILPKYGTGKEDRDDPSIVHREAIEAISLNKPRWFLVHEHVVIARTLLQPYRDTKKPGFVLQAGVPFKPTPMLSDLRVLELFELAMGHAVTAVKDRKGNWVQPYARVEDAVLFATAQFRRYREVEKYLTRLKPPVPLPAKSP